MLDSPEGENSVKEMLRGGIPKERREEFRQIAETLHATKGKEANRMSLLGQAGLVASELVPGATLVLMCLSLLGYGITKGTRALNNKQKLEDILREILVLESKEATNRTHTRP
jgi:hypothetical protein